MSQRAATESVCQLLVSVRSSSEVTAALHPSVAILDVKEPERGSLGAAERATVAEVVARVNGALPLSVALGELVDVDRERLSDFPVSISYAKFGLAGCAHDIAWPRKWAAAWEMLPTSVRRVAVAYADRELAESPDWRSVLEIGHRLGCQVLLIDTWNKHQGNLLRWLGSDELLEIRQSTRAARMQLALAGSLRVDDFPSLTKIHPDIVAVRSAVCAHARTGCVCPVAVEEVARGMAAFAHP